MHLQPKPIVFAFRKRILPIPLRPTIEKFDDSEYLYFVLETKRSTAEDICVQYDAHLVSIHSDRENQWANGELSLIL